MSNTITASVKLTDIDPKQEFLPRATLDQETIKEYARQMEEGIEFPPIAVFKQEKGGYLLAAGYHRFEAYKILNKEEIIVEIHDYTSDIEILKFAIESNTGHGKPLSNSDKRKAVTLVLKRANDWSDLHIAKLCKVSNHLVKDVRESLNIKKPTTVTAIRNGTQYQINHEEIGPDRSQPDLSKLLESKVNNLTKVLDTFMTAHQDPTVSVPLEYDVKIREFIKWYLEKNGGVI